MFYYLYSVHHPLSDFISGVSSAHLHQGNLKLKLHGEKVYSSAMVSVHCRVRNDESDLSVSLELHDGQVCSSALVSVRCRARHDEADLICIFPYSLLLKAG
jgi:hypothetical protein